MKRLAVVVALLALGACSSQDERPEVDWSQFAPKVHNRIAAEIDAKDCAALQGEFDAADSHNHADLMEYLDDAMKRAGCYD